MACYIDYPRTYIRSPRKGEWCHLLADTHEELMAMAEQIGHKPEWLQNEGTYREHYDVFGSTRREKLLKLGVKEITTRELATFLRRKRLGG